MDVKAVKLGDLIVVKLVLNAQIINVVKMECVQKVVLIIIGDKIVVNSVVLNVKITTVINQVESVQDVKVVKLGDQCAFKHAQHIATDNNVIQLMVHVLMVVQQVHGELLNVLINVLLNVLVVNVIQQMVNVLKAVKMEDGMVTIAQLNVLYIVTD